MSCAATSTAPLPARPLHKRAVEPLCRATQPSAPPGPGPTAPSRPAPPGFVWLVEPASQRFPIPGRQNKHHEQAQHMRKQITAVNWTNFTGQNKVRCTLHYLSTKMPSTSAEHPAKRALVIRFRSWARPGPPPMLLPCIRFIHPALGPCWLTGAPPHQVWLRQTPPHQARPRPTPAARGHPATAGW